MPFIRTLTEAVNGLAMQVNDGFSPTAGVALTPIGGGRCTISLLAIDRAWPNGTLCRARFGGPAGGDHQARLSATKSEGNRKDAFAGKRQANRFYFYFARRQAATGA